MVVDSDSDDFEIRRTFLLRRQSYIIYVDGFDLSRCCESVLVVKHGGRMNEA